MQEQNYKNHTRYVPVFHMGAYGLIAVILGASIVKFVNSYQTGIGGLLVPAILLMISIVLVLIAFYARLFALKAQDRAIRAEENLRHFVITGKLLDNKLRISQIVALRFAPNEELVNLAQRAAAENLSSRQIKKAIQNWKGDYHRV